jgi:hypothetical protein
MCCGADVLDLITQVCDNCVNRAVKLLNQSKVKISKGKRYYRECWKRLLHRHIRKR